MLLSWCRIHGADGVTKALFINLKVDKRNPSNAPLKEKGKPHIPNIVNSDFLERSTYCLFLFSKFGTLQSPLANTDSSRSTAGDTPVSVEALYKESEGTLQELSASLEKALEWASTSKDKRSSRQLLIIDYMEKLLASLWSFAGCSQEVSSENVSVVAGAYQLIEDVEAFLATAIDVETAFMSMPDLASHVTTLDGTLKAPATFFKISVEDVRGHAQSLSQHWSSALGKAAQDALLKPNNQPPAVQIRSKAT